MLKISKINILYQRAEKMRRLRKNVKNKKLHIFYQYSREWLIETKC